MGVIPALSEAKQEGSGADHMIADPRQMLRPLGLSMTSTIIAVENYAALRPNPAEAI